MDADVNPLPVMISANDDCSNGICEQLPSATAEESGFAVRLIRTQYAGIPALTVPTPVRLSNLEAPESPPFRSPPSVFLSVVIRV